MDQAGWWALGQVEGKRRVQGGLLEGLGSGLGVVHGLVSREGGPAMFEG